MFASSAASCAPSAIVWPTYGVLEKGALIATSKVVAESGESPSPPQGAGTRAHRGRRKRATRFKGLEILERLAAQVRGSHRFVGRDLGQRARCDPPPSLEYRDEVGDATHETEVVLDHEQAQATVAQRAQQV